MTRRAVSVLVVMLIALMLISSCSVGGSDVSTTVEPPSTNPVSTTIPMPATTTTTPMSTTTRAETTTTGLLIDVYYEGGQVVGPDRIEVEVGDVVSVWALSDVDESIHVHGYDLVFAAKADVPIEISLTAGAPGIFEVELESSHTLLFELEVSP